MMTMCPICFELYSDIWSKPYCNCGCKTINISVELIISVQLFIKMGFVVISASCTTHNDEEDKGKVTQIRIDFGNKYAEAFFPDLPPDWLISDYQLVMYNQILEPKLTMLSCVCYHPPDEADSLSIEFEKLLTVSNLEVWLEGKDPEACKAILVLAGCL